MSVSGDVGKGRRDEPGPSYATSGDDVLMEEGKEDGV